MLDELLTRARASSSAPPYICPTDRSPLTARRGEHFCAKCNKRFRQDELGIVCLDLIRSPEAVAFDERAIDQDCLAEAEIESSRRLADRFVQLAFGSNPPRFPAILDVACGRGELAIGLLLNERVKRGDILALDHSIASLKVLARTAKKIGVDAKLRVSQQDVRALCFSPGAFDAVFGNAVLHHFLDYEEFLGSVRDLLKPGGVAVFAEPFAEGYLLAMMLFKIATRLTGISAGGEESAEMGLYKFIVENIGQRIRNARNPVVLQQLTEKHVFSVSRLLELSNRLGFSISLFDYAEPSYYDGFIDDILNTYRISQPEMVRVSRQLYSELREYVGNEFTELFSHFRFMRLERRHR